jgi:polyhydroxyalkanoate synthesis repressor PhaR
MTILIKRYANRKLYNTQTSRYITLKGIAELIDGDEDVRVIDNESGEDITSVALSQILVDSEREGRRVSRPLLSGLLQRGGDVLYGALRRGVGDASPIGSRRARPTSSTCSRTRSSASSSCSTCRAAPTSRR